MKLLKGKKIADEMLRGLKKKIAKQKKKPGLAVVLVGDNKASQVYVELKQQAAGKVDMDFWVLKFSARDSEKDVLQAIKELNADENIQGIIVQLPLPKKFNADKIIRAIDPRKDADGFLGTDPVFPQAIIKLLESCPKAFSKSLALDSKLSFEKKAVVISNSKIFGETMKNILRKKKIKAEYLLNSEFRMPNAELKDADIIITAVGKPGLLKGSMIKKGSIIIDGGITKRGKKVLGDADFRSVSKVAGFLSPVPGGVGPLTIACLLENVWKLSKK